MRRATTTLGEGDRLELFYDERVLAAEALLPKCLSDQRRYSIRQKPSRLLSQGAMYGDHCSLERRVALFFKGKRKVFVAHRLETTDLHTPPDIPPPDQSGRLSPGTKMG